MKKKVIKTNAVRMIEQKKIPYTVHEYEWDEQNLDAMHVAHDMGVSPEEIYKTIVLHGDKTGYLAACVAGDMELNLKALAKVSGNKKVELIPVKDLEKLTGYVRGGCSPIGMKKQFPTYIDEVAKEQKTIRVSGGKRGIQIELTPEDLQKMTRAIWFINNG
ncbi:Cys-tRNA(Pro)/Cys-tRNA(Cys) deacylase [Granulicatella balaenopterae]|uniref:Cys-tRNA(Pro)/Cys-tRNA(Cys) deacylase n=1 Tax=Granulicatella balaenopterae TaxID=137733 RepID=A0A1H9NQK9_9LACT|nr:Cys-tRNA(Pro)/Cys-tRNA(Cys) deacylase [Granulicatella balaenopterae]